MERIIKSGDLELLKWVETNSKLYCWSFSNDSVRKAVEAGHLEFLKYFLTIEPDSLSNEYSNLLIWIEYPANNFCVLAKQGLVVLTLVHHDLKGLFLLEQPFKDRQMAVKGSDSDDC